MSTRSHQGCWTCKNRRRRCDNTRPTCRNCEQRGVACEGYEVRLRWGTGIASRGKFMGADKPVKESVPPRQKGRQRDLSRERRKAAGARQLDSDNLMTASDEPGTSPGQDTCSDEALFNEFVHSGINVLHSTSAQESMLQPRLPELCQESNALYTTCLAFQLSLAPSLTPRFFEYFDAALRTFRSELACSTSLLDGTLAAGLLLCSVGLMHGFPWTVHLEGMHNILLEDLHPSTPSKFRTHLLEVMGVLDIPIFAIGRQTPSIGIWQRYCQRAEPRGGVEPVTGLPRALLDMLAGIGFETTEQSFWDWPGYSGNFLQCYLWEAHRLAGILTLRQQARLPGNQQPSNVSAWRQPGACPADSTVLVARILANLDALRLACAEGSEEDTFIQNATNYPLLVAGLEITVLRPRPDWQKKIRSFLRHTRQDELILSLMEEMWLRDDPHLSVDQVAQERGIEMGVL